MTHVPQDQGVAVSIIMPVRNTPPRLLYEAVFSVVTQQTEHRIELVLWDDESDRSGVRSIGGVATAARLLHPQSRMVVGRNDRRLGPGLSRNAAVHASHGRYLLWLDSDDVLAPGSIQKLVDVAQELDRHGAAPDMVISECVVLAADGTPRGPKRSPRAYLDLVARHAGSADDPLAQVIFAIQAQLVTRESFDLVGGFSKNYALAEMTEFFLRWVRTHGADRIATLDFVAYRYRRRPDSYSTVNRGEFLNCRFDALQDYVRDTGIEAEVVELRGRSDRTGAQHYRLGGTSGLYRPTWESEFGPFTDPEGTVLQPHETGDLPAVPG